METIYNELKEPKPSLKEPDIKLYFYVISSKNNKVIKISLYNMVFTHINSKWLRSSYGSYSKGENGSRTGLNPSRMAAYLLLEISLIEEYKYNTRNV